MDRKRQLGNAAFGGGWSEAIEERGRIAEAMGADLPQESLKNLRRLG